MVNFHANEADAVSAGNSARFPNVWPRRAAIFHQREMTTELIDAKEAARMMKICVGTLWHRLKKGKFPPPVTPPGCKRLWNKEDIEYCLRHRWNEQVQVEPETPAQRKWREALEEAECARWGI